MDAVATPEVKGVPPGLTAEPLDQHSGSVSGVPEGLIAEPMTAGATKEAVAAVPKFDPFRRSNLKEIPPQQRSDQTMATPYPRGLAAEGNLPIWNRPAVQNADGKHSSEYSTSFKDEDGGGYEVLVPTIVNGKFLTPDGKKPKEGSDAEKAMFQEAWKHYKKSGEHLGKFDNPENANAYSQILHSRGDKAEQPQQQVKGVPPELTAHPIAAQGTLRANHPSQWQNLKSAVGRTETGQIVESNLDQLGQMWKNTSEKLNNPGAMTDQEWEETRKKQTAFFEKHLGAAGFGGAAAGAAEGVAEFGEEMMSPFQILLLAGTAGESGLAQIAQRTGIPGAVPAAKTLAKLVQVQFATQMIEGVATGAEEAVKSAWNGDWEGTSKAAVSGLASGLMAKGLVSHEMASERVHRDLDATAQQTHGTSFDHLNPYDQGIVIDQTVKASPEYKAILDKADEQQEKGKDDSKKQRHARLKQYYSAAVAKAWQPDAAQRTIDGIQRAGEEDDRHQKIREVVATVKAAADARQKAIDEESQTRVTAARDERPETRQRASAARTASKKIAEGIKADRESVYAERKEAQQSPSNVAQREVESVQSEDGTVTYPANYWGEENSFGVTGDITGHGVYRQTPRGVEWLDRNGNFVEEPEDVFTHSDPHAADTIARLSSLSATADTLADAEGATPEQKADAEHLAAIRRDLVSGEIDTKEAQRQAGIAERVTVSDAHTAAREGQLTGPFHDSSAGEYRQKLEDSVRKAVESGETGWEEEDIQSVVDQSASLARQQTETALHHVYQPGDYIVSKRGVRWTLDSRGMLHPDDGGPAHPLMRDGMYSGPAVQLAETGRIGYGTRTREERRMDAVKRREVEESIRQSQDEVAREMRLAAQSQGLQTAEAPEPRADTAEKQVRERRRMSRPPRPAESPESQIVRMVLQAPSKAGSVIQSIARAKQVTPEEVMRLSLATDPAMSGTPEQKIAGLESGDRIVEPIRKKPWVVETGKDGKTYLRSGNAQPLKLDRLNPSDEVKGIIGRGEIEKDQEPGDVEKVAFGNPHYVRWQDDQVADVEELAKKPAPEPKTEKQAAVQVQATERRAAAALSVATKKTIEAIEPKTESIEEAEKKVDEATEAVKTAEEAYAQSVEAKSNLEPKDVFSQKAPVSIGLKGESGTIVQNGREVPFHYELVPIDALTTSHEWNGKAMVENPGYPSELQPRTISDSEAAQNALRAERGTYDFRQYADKTINGSMGPAIVDAGGQVVGGNTRLAILRKHLSILEGTPDVEERQALMAGMKARMRQLALDSGIARYPEDGKMYVAVRMMDRPIETAREAAELGRLFNKKIGVEIGKAAKGVSYSKSLDKDVLREIGRLVDAHDSIAAAITKEPDFFNKIVSDRFDVGPEEEADWFREVGNDQIKQKILSEDGRNQFEKAVLGVFIKDSSILNRLQGKTPFNALQRALSYMVKMLGMPHLDITQKIAEAMQAAAETDGTNPGLSQHRDEWHATYRPEQKDFLGMEAAIPPEPDRMTEVLWRALHAGNRTLNDRLKSYLGEESAGAMQMFAAKQESPVAAFNRTFRKEFEGAEHLRKDAIKGITPEQFEAAVQNLPLGDIQPAEEEAVRPEREGQETAPTKYKLGNTHASLEGTPAGESIIAAQRNISDADLAGDGKSIDEPHVTVRYGIQGDDTARIRKYIESQAPFEAKLGKTDAFPPSEYSGGAVPIIAPVESPEFHRINAEIERHGDFKKSDFNEYKPHATVAYVKAEAAEKYKGMTDTEGKTFRVSSIDISGRDGKTETVELKGKRGDITRPPKAGQAEFKKEEVSALPEGVMSYGSGANSLADMSGHFKANMPIGVSVSELSAASLEKLSDYAADGHPIFVDSGAFSEVEFGPDGVRVKNPITDEEWNKRLDNYLKIARAAHKADNPNATFVAPDMVGSQDVTLSRLRQFKGKVEDLLNLEAHVLIPLQNGSRNPAEFFSEAKSIFEGAYNAENLTPAFPMNKAAANAEKVVGFLESVPGVKRIHLLGTSMNDAVTRKLVTMIREQHPDVQVTLDANRLRAKTAEIGDRAREVREELMADAMGETAGRDYTEQIYQPGQWASREALKRIATKLESVFPDFEPRMFLSDPDQYLAKNVDEINDWWDQVLTDEYLKSVGKDVSSIARSRAVETAMDREKPRAITRPPKGTGPEQAATEALGAAKARTGYVTPEALKTFLETSPATKDHAPELLRTAKLMAEYVYDADPPVGTERKDALDWVLRERLAGIEKGELKSARGQYSDPNIEKGMGDAILRLHKAADPTTFIHEFGHVIFPLLSEEDMKAIATIKGPRGAAEWDGQRGTLKGDVYKSMTERLAHGMEQFLRDENPTGFTHEVKAVLAKIKDIMRKVYLAFKSDPLSDYQNTEESREVFAKMFGIADFDVADDWRQVVKQARAEDTRLKRPSEETHPLVKMASDMGAQSVRGTFAGKPTDTVGDRVDPRKSEATIVFNKEDAVMAAWATLPTPKIPNAELIAGDGEWGIRFNTKSELPPDVLQQGLPEKHPGLELADLEERLKGTPTFKIMERKLLQLRIDNLKNRIRAHYAVEEEAPKSDPELVKAVKEEVQRGKTDSVRKTADGVSRTQGPERASGISKPPLPGMPRNAGARGERGGAPRESVAGVTSLAEVKPVNLQPLAKERGTPVGTLKGQEFDSKAWADGLKSAGLPENLPPPTYALDPRVAQVLKFPGQKQIVQTVMSGLEHGDGVVVASATGTGKTYTALATAREFRNLYPEAKILHLTKNRGLLKDAAKVAANSFGMELEKDVPESPEIEPGIYGATHIGNLNNKIYRQIKWDLVLTDESGELRNWFRDENKVGKAGIDTTNNANKVVYFSATPFHSPNEYGYLTKLNLWPKGQFDKWIEGNFAHEKVGDKIVARLDPAKQAKLRQQLIERGQLVSQSISYEGFNAHFGVVPVTDQMKRKLDRVREGFARARDQFVRMGKKGMAEKTAAFEATYTKALLERERIPQAIDLVRKARAQGWHVMVFSETSAEDLFRRPRTIDSATGEYLEPSTYQMLDDAMGGTLSKIIPPFDDVYDSLREEFGSEIVDYSGRGNTMASRDAAKSDFLTGKAPMLYTTYAAGGIGVSLHDADYPDMNVTGGDKPRVAIFLGPPYSGVLLEQAMGRPWRFGTKSDVHAVFLATDSAPDIHLMQTKVGPRMKALRAAVHGEKDSLANVMQTYSSDQQVRERQDMMAYAEGDEVKVTAANYQVRSKGRDVGIQDWSQIAFPPAKDAMNKGMKYGEAVGGETWSNLFQSNPDGMERPQDARARKLIDSMANAAISGKEPLLAGLEPADKEMATALSAAVATPEVELPVERDKDNTARQAMEASLRENALIPYHGIMLSQEQGMLNIARLQKRPEVGHELRRMNRSYRADYDVNLGQYWNLLEDAMKRQGMQVEKNMPLPELWDVVEGKRVSADPKVMALAADVSDMMAIAHDELATAGVAVKTKGGTAKIPYKDFPRDAHYMPHRIDWDYEMVDPTSGERVKVRDFLKKDEKQQQRLLDSIPELKPYSRQQVTDYLRRSDPRAPRQSNVHFAREVNFPFIKKDYSTLLGYFDQVSQAIAAAKNFGPEEELLNGQIDKITDVRSNSTLKSMFRAALQPQDWTGATGKLYNAAVAFEAASKMTFSAFKVPFHLVLGPVALKGRVMPHIRAFGRMAIHPKEVMERATFAGTVIRQTDTAEMMYGERMNSPVRQILRKEMFEAAYRMVRAISGESARVYLEQYALRDLKKGAGAEHTRRMLRDVFLIGDHGIDEAVRAGRFKDEDLLKAQTAFTNMAAFSGDPMQMPQMARLEMSALDPRAISGLKRAVRLTYALQSFSVKAMSVLREHLWDEVMVNGNKRPLMYALIAFPTIGTLLNLTSTGVKHAVNKGLEGAADKTAGALGHPQQPRKDNKDSWENYIQSLEDTFEHPEAVKLLKWYVDSWTLAAGAELFKTLGDPLFNIASGKPAKTDAYWLQDMAEHVAGPFFSDLWKSAEEVSNLQKIHAGKTHPEKKGEKYKRSLLKYASDEVPALRQVPWVSDRIQKEEKKPFFTPPPRYRASEAQHEDARADIPPIIQRIAQSLNVRTEAGGHLAGYGSGESAIASVDENDPSGRVEINDAARFAQGPKQILGHEIFHVWRRNLPGATQRQALPIDESKPYDLSDIDDLRRRGVTMATIPEEKGGKIVQTYIARPEERQRLQPWIDDMEREGMSLIQATDPRAAQINTTPRTPMAPL